MALDHLRKQLATHDRSSQTLSIIWKLLWVAGKPMLAVLMY